MTASKPCEFCGKPFSRKPYHTAKLWRVARFCSRSCSGFGQHPPESERFWAKVDKRGPDDCWEWQASTTWYGYGEMHTRGRGRGRAHRLAWEFAFGPVPDGLHVLHRCDNPPCVNPAHLFLGTHADNMADMHAKGRANSARGEQASGSKLTADQVRAIRERHASGDGQRALGREFGVDHTTIGGIVSGRTWGHLA